MGSAMRTKAPKRKPHCAKGRISSGEGLRALIAFAALAGLLLSFFVTAGSYFIADRQTKSTVAKIALVPLKRG
jgi:hypothetical protein